MTTAHLRTDRDHSGPEDGLCGRLCAAGVPGVQETTFTARSAVSCRRMQSGRDDPAERNARLGTGQTMDLSAEAPTPMIRACGGVFLSGRIAVTEIHSELIASPYLAKTICSTKMA